MSAAPEAVLDATALLAFLLDEPGAQTVNEVITRAAISAVNYAEVADQLVRLGMPHEDVAEALEALGLMVVPVTAQLAVVAAALQPLTRYFGLSLADRLCLALATQLDVPAYTTDRTWTLPQQPAKVMLITGYTG